MTKQHRKLIFDTYIECGRFIDKIQPAIDALDDPSQLPKGFSFHKFDKKLLESVEVVITVLTAVHRDAMLNNNQ